VRIVLDTNILVSALMSIRGAPAQLVELAACAAVQNLTSEALLLELHHVLNRPLFNKQDHSPYMQHVRAFSECVTPTEKLHHCKDEPDNRVLECAVAGRADYIISGDKELLGLGRCRGIPIVSARAFLDLHFLTSK
jgi:uncharacterized protein